MDNLAIADAQWAPACASHSGKLRGAAAIALMFASGACALVWQMIWTAGFAVALGHEIVAVLAVVGAFFGGLAAGSFLLAGRIERSTRAGLWYAALEAGIAVWGLGVTLVLPSLASPVAQWTGPVPSPWTQGALALGLPFLLLLPATIAMGATLPALERQLRAAGRLLPVLYASNTAGALAGLLFAAFVWIPEAGVRAAATGCAAVNMACAVTALLVWRRGAPQRETSGPPANVQRVGAGPALRLLCTGLLGIGFEVLAVRVLSQVSENTVYTYALLLASFLLATAAGAAYAHKALPEPERWGEAADRLLLWLAAAVLMSGTALWWSDRLVALPTQWAGQGLWTALAGEALAGAVAIAPAAFVMGALFSLLCLQARLSGWPLGRALGLNTLGCAIAPALVGALLLPALGAQMVLGLLVAGYVALCSRGAWRTPAPAIIAAAALALATLAPPLRFVEVPEGGRIMSYREGAMAAVSVVTDADDVARLHINNRVQEGSSASGMMETRLAQLPLLMHPAPHEALFLGLGTGYTAHAAAIEPGVHVTAVELLPEVINSSNLFMLRPAAPRNSHPVDVVAADARRFVLSSDKRYDVIVADLFHPARNGAASLYTAEHFQAVGQRLAPGGLFCQWLALHQMDLPTLRSIVAAFVSEFPDGVAILAGNSLDTPVIGLVARPRQPRWRLADVQARLDAPTPAITSALSIARIDSAYAVLGSMLADAPALRRFAQGAAVNSDDKPVVAAQAARVDYAPEASPRERLAALLQAFPDAPQDALAHDDPAASRLAAYWRARARYIDYGLHLRSEPDAHAMLDSLGPRLLALVTESPQFQPAADSLASLAQAVQGDDYPLSQRVLAALRHAQGKAPSNPTTSSQP